MFNKEISRIAVLWAVGALNSMRLEANFGQYEWVGEVNKPTWSSNCIRIQPSSSGEKQFKVIQSYVKIN